MILRAAGALDCAKKTVQWEGLTGLYKVLLLLQTDLHTLLLYYAFA